MANTSLITGKFDFSFFVNLECNGKKNVLEWCITMNLVSHECECPECRLPMALKEKDEDIDGYVWVCCHQKEDIKQFVEISVRHGSFFQLQSDISFTKILLMTYLWIKKATPEFIEDELNLPISIVNEWLNFCREVCVEICINKNTKLGGEKVIVEIAESAFQEKKFKRNEKAVGRWIYVGFEKETDKGFIEVVEKQSVESLVDVINKYVLPGTILVSDCWKLHDCLEDEDFVSFRNNQSITFEDIGVGEYGCTVIGLRRSIKRSLNDEPKISTNLDLFFAEYMWRRTHSDTPYELMRSFLKEIVILFPLNTEN